MADGTVWQEEVSATFQAVSISRQAIIGLALGLAVAVVAQPAGAASAVTPGEAPDDADVPFVRQQPAGPAPAQIPGGAGSVQPTTPAASGKVTGTVTYRERIALPPNAVIQVSLLDVSRADAAAITLGEQSITAGGAQVPIPFEITYDPAAIDQRFTYSVRARITVDGQLLFTSTTTAPVITRGNPTHVEIVLQRV